MGNTTGGYAIEEILRDLTICESWITPYAIFQRTGEKELTLIVRIHGRNTVTEEEIDHVKRLIEQRGWTMKIPKKVKDVNVVPSR